MAVTDPNALWAQALNDPSVTSGKSALTRALINAATAYGDSSSLFAPSGATDPSTGLPTTLAALYGIRAGDVSAAPTNPYSTLAQLGQQTQKDTGTIENNMAGRGLEFSGAHAASQQSEANADQLRRYGAQQGLQSTISNIGSQYSGLISGAYGTLMNAALADPTIPAAPVPAPNMVPPAPTPGQTYLPGGGVTGPAAPAASPGPREFIPPKVTIPKVKPLTGYQGHA